MRGERVCFSLCYPCSSSSVLLVCAPFSRPPESRAFPGLVSSSCVGASLLSLSLVTLSFGTLSGRLRAIHRIHGVVVICAQLCVCWHGCVSCRRSRILRRGVGGSVECSLSGALTGAARAGAWALLACGPAPSWVLCAVCALPVRSGPSPGAEFAPLARARR